jgi:hypothetical protein
METSGVFSLRLDRLGARLVGLIVGQRCWDWEGFRVSLEMMT